MKRRFALPKSALNPAFQITTLDDGDVGRGSHRPRVGAVRPEDVCSGSAEFLLAVISAHSCVPQIRLVHLREGNF